MSSNKIDIEKAAVILWEYMQLDHPIPQHSDIIFVLGSRDERVAQYAAQLFLEGRADCIVVSGGIGHKNDILATKWKESEANHFAAIMIQLGVPQNKILIEDRATNTGENIAFTFELLEKERIQSNSIILVQKPYMERRTYATFVKQWPGRPMPSIVVSSSRGSLFEYCNHDQPFDTVVNIMVGDFDRIVQYPKHGYQIEQNVPENVQKAVDMLVAFGYNKHLLQQ